MFSRHSASSSPLRHALADGHWHHVAATLSLASGGTLKLWIDGESPDGFSAALNLSASAVVSSLGTFQLLPDPFSGAIDEVALYAQPLSDDVVYAHSTRALKHHQPYTEVSVRVGPAPPPTTVSVKTVTIHGATGCTVVGPRA